MSPSILYPFVVVMALGLYHVTSVQSADIPAIVASLVRIRSMGNGQWKRVVNAVAENGHERKGVTLEEEDDDDDSDGQRLDRDYLEEAVRQPEQGRSPSASHGDLSSILLKKSDAVVSKGENHLQLKDRDYFQAIGIAPSDSQWNAPGGNHWYGDYDK